MTKRLDNPQFKGSDRGCKTATEYLGYRSVCTECPFKPNCIYDSPRGAKSAKKIKRNELIIEMLSEGVTAVRIAKELGVDRRTVRNVKGNVGDFQGRNVDLITIVWVLEGGVL